MHLSTNIDATIHKAFVFYVHSRWVKTSGANSVEDYDMRYDDTDINTQEE
jgi:hypothetical protein